MYKCPPSYNRLGINCNTFHFKVMKGGFFLNRTVWSGIKLACVYTGVMLGAGFASGQEIIKFFTNHGINGVYGLILSGILFGLIGWAVMDSIYNRGYKSYHDMAQEFFGKQLGFVMEVVVLLFMIVLFSAMISAGGSLLQDVLGIDFSIGTLIICALCFFTLLFGANGVIGLNVIIAPLMALGIALICLNVVFDHPISLVISMKSHTESGSWVTSSILYVSYNIITVISVLCAVGDKISSKKEALLGAVFGGIAICILGFCLFIPTIVFYDKIIGREIPMLGAISNMSTIIKGLYLFVLINAIFTTAVGNAYATEKWICQKTSGNNLIVKILLISFGYLFAHIGFSNFVGNFYPVFGYVGLFETILLLLYLVLPKRRQRKS